MCVCFEITVVWMWPLLLNKVFTICRSLYCLRYMPGAFNTNRLSSRYDWCNIFAFNTRVGRQGLRRGRGGRPSRNPSRARAYRWLMRQKCPANSVNQINKPKNLWPNGINCRSDLNLRFILLRHMTRSYGLGVKCPDQVIPAGQLTPCDGTLRIIFAHGLITIIH